MKAAIARPLYDDEWGDMSVVTDACPLCGQKARLSVNTSGYMNWKLCGRPIQDSLPMLTAGQREQLISGYHPACWDTAFSA